MIAEQPCNDRRKTPRFPIGNLVAELDLLDGNEPVLICIWDLSLGGACLMIPPDLKLPAQFDLYIDGLCHPVEKVWQWPAPSSEDTELGVFMELEVRHGEAE